MLYAGSSSEIFCLSELRNALAVHNVGNGPAFNIRSVIYGPEACSIIKRIRRKLETSQRTKRKSLVPLDNLTPFNPSPKQGTPLYPYAWKGEGFTGGCDKNTKYRIVDPVLVLDRSSYSHLDIPKHAAPTSHKELLGGTGFCYNDIARLCQGTRVLCQGNRI